MYGLILAATNSAKNAATGPDLVRFPAQNDVMTWAQTMGIGTCLLLIVVGAVYLLYGWQVYRPLITLNAAIIGGYIGVLVGQRAGGYALPGGFLGALVAGALAWPLMKWAVSMIGGICGAVAGASVWLTVGLDPRFAWAGAMTGLVGFGLFSFILFRGSIIMYTSLQGALMVIIGALGLVFKYPDFAPTLSKNLATQPLVLPIAILVPAVLGLIFQQMHSPGGGPAPAGGDKKK